MTFDDQSGKLGGRLTGRAGRTRPLTRAEWKKNELTFVDRRIRRERQRRAHLPGQDPLRHAGRRGQRAQRTVLDVPGQPGHKFQNRGRVPWGKPVTLISKGLLGWRLRGNGKGACWKESAGVISNRDPCVDIVSDGRYQDFKLHLELKLEPGARTGVYLRGRYEVQLNDDAGKPTSDESIGAVYGLVVPTKNAGAGPGDWQRLDVTLVGRQVTVVLNGDK